MNEEIKEKDDKLYELDLEIQQKNAEIEELNEKLLEFDDLKKITEKQSIQIRDYLNEIQNQKALVDE